MERQSSPRPAVHNLTTILADDGTGGQQPTDPMNYSLSSMPASGSDSMVLGKSNGAYELVVWAEPKLWKDVTDTEISNPARDRHGEPRRRASFGEGVRHVDRNLGGRQLYRRQHDHRFRSATYL